MVIVYDLNMKPAAALENSFNEGYDQVMNELWTAQFSLPANDPKNVECQPFRFAEFFDGKERIDLFRILPYKHEKNSEGITKTYQCEHVLGTLIDDILFQYHQTTNLSPADTVSFILSKQTTIRWQLGTVDFTDLYSYKWENENLLSGLFSIPKAYTDEYMWTWNTDTYPWTLNLIRPSNQVSAYIRYRKNLVGISKVEDPTYIRTRLYALGYGEGINQLTIESVNGGIPYIDADTKDTYGIIADFYIDKTEENPTTLKAKTQALIEQIKIPRVTCSVNAADIWQITQDSTDKFMLSAVVQAYDDESGIEFTQRVVKRSKSNYSENPGDIKLEIANKVLDISDTTTGLQQKQRVNDVYAQGATNIDSNDYEDNCDAAHPAIVKFYIPTECVRINKCLLSYQTSKFRSYETGAASKDLGTLSISTNTTGQSSITTTTDGQHVHTFGQLYTGNDEINGTGHRHWIDIDNTWGGGPHSHNLSHTHGINHTHTIGSHAHDIVYGIYEKPEMPIALTIKVDDTLISDTALNGNDIDLVNYLSTDTNGKIKRGQFHTVEITPNNLARITATVIKQIFMQSRGGGDY